MGEDDARAGEKGEIAGILADLDSIFAGPGTTSADRSAPVQQAAPAPANQPVQPAGASEPNPPDAGRERKTSAPPAPISIKLELDMPRISLSPVSSPAAEAPVSPTLSIELPPRDGMIPPVKKAIAAPTPKMPRAASLSAYRPPLEVSLDVPEPTLATPAPTVERSTAAPSAPTSPSAPDSIRPAPEERPGASEPSPSMPEQSPPSNTVVGGASNFLIPPDTVPADAPRDQIRRVAYLYAGPKGTFERFRAFVESMATHVTKKPLFLRACIVCEITPGENAQRAIEAIKGSGAVAALGVLESSDPRWSALDAAFSGASIYFRTVDAVDVEKRSAVVDMLVDLTLLNAG